MRKEEQPEGAVAAEVKNGFHALSVDELMAGRPPAREMEVIYPAYKARFILRQITDANELMAVGRKGAIYAEVGFEGPDGKPVRMDENLAYSVARLEASMSDPKWTGKQIAMLIPADGALVVDLCDKARQVNEVEGQIGELKKG